MNGLVDAAAGFAADERGNGVAYVRLTLRGASKILRVPFTVKRYPALLNREVGYAALAAAAAALHQRGIERVRFTIDDAQLAGDLREHREVPVALTLAYVRVRCALNQFKTYDIALAPAESDLTARARGEASMNVAA